jgi:hypothetical protein
MLPLAHGRDYRRHHAQSGQNARPSGKGRLPMSPSIPMGKYLDMLKRLDATAAMNSRRAS